MAPLVPADFVERRIYLIRGWRVMLDRDLAALYGVTTSNLNKAVARNKDRFPPDFMFRLTRAEASALIFQSGISKPPGRGGSRYPPNTFTEQGVSMLSSVLRSPRAIAVNIEIMRTFVRLRRTLAEDHALAVKLAEHERRIGAAEESIQTIFEAIERLDSPPESPRRKIGFEA